MKNLTEIEKAEKLAHEAVENLARLRKEAEGLEYCSDGYWLESTGCIHKQCIGVEKRTAFGSVHKTAPLAELARDKIARINCQMQLKGIYDEEFVADYENHFQDKHTPYYCHLIDSWEYETNCRSENLAIPLSTRVPEVLAELNRRFPNG